jgi:predicted amidohydrolase
MSVESLITELPIAVCQMTSVDDVSENVLQITNLLSKIPNETKVAFFPENCLYMRVLEGEKIPGVELSDAAFVELANLAQEKNIYLHLGSVPLKKHNKLTNASVLISPDGRVQSTYEKIHLFDINLIGQAPIRESDVFSHGESAQMIDLNGWNFGQSICYDLRFSDLYSYYSHHDVDALLVPAAFLVKTGLAHWETLLRARAIETQSYVIAAAQAGKHHGAKAVSKDSFRETFGHSLVIDPWGQVEMMAKTDGPEVMVTKLLRSKIQQVRKQIPMKNHRRQWTQAKG